jgi:hypothetical protein
MKKILSLSVTLTLASLAIFSAQAANAASDEEIAEALLSQTSDVLEIELSDGLSDDLLLDLVDGLEKEEFESEIVEQIDASLESEQDLNLEEELNESLSDSLSELEETAPLWVEAMNQVRQEFQECRLQSLNASECAKGLGFRLQVAKSTAQLAQIEMDLANIQELPEEEREQALVDLLAQQEAISKQLERATNQEAVMASNAGNGQSNAKNDLEKAKDKNGKVKNGIEDVAEEIGAELPNEGSNPGNSNKPANTGNGAGNNGNNGAGNNGNNGAGNNGKKP